MTATQLQRQTEAMWREDVRKKPQRQRIR